ncbi:hypothetical protein LguiB_012765 [Lonicera macranthoides]
MCDRCPFHTESALHMLRDCFTSRAIWEFIVTFHKLGVFFGLHYSDRLCHNTGGQSQQMEFIGDEDELNVVEYFLKSAKVLRELESFLICLQKSS